MSRAFSKEEKTRIRERLLEVGEERFARYGLKKTSIADLTAPVGIAKSSFYLFFESKEALYVELLLKRAQGLQQQMLRGSFGATDDLRDAIARFLRGLVEVVESENLVRYLLTDTQEALRIIRSVAPKAVRVKSRPLLEPFLKIIEEGQRNDEIIEGDPEVIANILGLIKLLPLHKQDLDPAIYLKLVEMAINVTADGLTCPARMRREGQ